MDLVVAAVFFVAAFFVILFSALLLAAFTVFAFFGTLVALLAAEAGAFLVLEALAFFTAFVILALDCPRSVKSAVESLPISKWSGATYA